MNTRSFVWILVVCALAILISLNLGLPFGRGTQVGAAAFVLAVLSSCAWVLRVAASKKRSAPAYFGIGVVLLLVGFPFGGEIVSLFVAPGQQRGSFAPVEMIFGLLGLACIFRSWLLWSNHNENA